jgi:hypothetical protein
MWNLCESADCLLNEYVGTALPWKFGYRPSCGSGSAEHPEGKTGSKGRCPSHAHSPYKDKAVLSTSRKRTGEAEVQPQSFLTAALDCSEWSASRPGHSTPVKDTRYVLNMRLGGPQCQSGRFGEENVSCPCWDSNPGPAVARLDNLAAFYGTGSFLNHVNKRLLSTALYPE